MRLKKYLKYLPNGLILFLILNYFLPYRIDNDSIFIGFPVEFLRIDRSIFMTNKLYLTTSINVVALFIDILFFIATVYCIEYFIKNILKEKFNRKK